MKSVLLSGAGNTFHFFYNISQKDKNILSSSKKIQNLCEQYPADGLVFLNLDIDNKYYWDFYNKDGSQAEMCGNATRCVGYYVENILKKDFSNVFLKTAKGTVEIQMQKNNLYTVLMLPTCVLKHESLFFCNTGVPHVVFEISQTDKSLDWFSECKRIRQDQFFQPEGTNVTVVQIIENPKSSIKNIKAVSFERGVENFTKACGTGAIAAALYLSERYQIQKSVIEMPGGDLTIDVTDYSKPTMMGPATFIQEYDYEF